MLGMRPALAASAVTLLDTFVSAGLLVIEIRQGDARQPLADLPFDPGQRLLLGRGDQHEGVAFRLGPGGAADAVDVVVRHVRHVEADDVRDVVHVQAAGRDVGGHQHLEVAAAKAVHGPVPLRLRQVAVQLGHREAVGGDALGQPLGRLLGPREHQHRGHLRVPQQVAQQVALEMLGHRVGGLGDAHGRGAAPADLDHERIAQDLGGQLGDHRRHGRREEQRLLAGRQAGDDPLEVGQEAHVEHAVGLVEDERVQLVEAGLVLPHVIQEPAGRGDEHLDAGPQRLFLRPHGRAADHEADLERRVVARPRQTSSICWASSRVGVMTRAWVVPRGSARSRCRIGSRKAAVLPVPVWAVAMRSRPARMAGMASA